MGNEEEVKNEQVAGKRDAFMSNFDESHPGFENAVDGQPVEQEEVPDSKESDKAEAPAVIEEQSDSSSVKEETKKTDKTEKQVVDKTTELLSNKEKALHEEREKRKQANLKLRDLQRQFDEKLKDLEKRLEASLKPDSVDDFDESADPTVKNLQQKVKELQASKTREENERKQAEILDKQKRINDQVLATDKDLREEGMPGFRWAAVEVDKVLRQLIDEGEYTIEDYSDPKVWKEVYRTKVYETVASEFKAIEKKETMEKKLDRKKQASKVSMYPGAKPQEVKENEDDDDGDSVEDYLKFRNKTAAKRIH